MKKILFFLSLTLLFCSCGRPKLDQIPDPAVCVGMNTLLTIPVGPSQIVVTDYIMIPEYVDSVTTTDEWLVAALSDDKHIVELYCGEEVLPMASLEFWVGGTAYSLPLVKSDKKIHTFTYDPHGTNPSRVQIAGQMNNWVASMTPDLQLRADGLYAVDILLSPGTYLYQLRIDGNQSHDVTNPAKVDNGYGQFNSVMQVDGYDQLFPRLVTRELSKKEFSVTMYGDVDRVWLYWDNVRLDERFVTLVDNVLTVKVPTEAQDIDRSYVRLWVANRYGVSNQVLVPIDEGRVVSDASSLSRNDKYSQIIYFMLVDRFVNGNKGNDRPMNRPDVNPKADYMGGDLAGIRQVIDDDYFQRLGVNTLWVSPLNQNPLEPYGYNDIANTKFAGYHGYWPISSSQVDFRFGTNDELRGLVADAHDHDINILLDYVANHVHEEHPLYQAHPEYATPLYLPDGRMNVELWDEERLTTWFDTFMPSLDYSNPEVLNTMIDSAMFWITEFGIDGFRHDACKHVSEDYWRLLTYRLKENDPEGNFYQIGESYGSPELMQSYVNSGMLSGQFDFNVFDEATSTFNGVSGGTMTRLSNVLKSSLHYYGVHNLMGYISGNHDKPRFMALASGDIAVGEDAKVAGWTREIGITDSSAYDRLSLLHTFNITIPGVPVIYYGDEMGMTGGNDPDCRRMMYFEGWNERENHLFNNVAALNHLRHNNMSLTYGDFLPIETTDSTMTYCRKYFDNVSFIAINNSTSTCRLALSTKWITADCTDFEALFSHPFEIKDDVIYITLPALSSEVLYK